MANSSKEGSTWPIPKFRFEVDLGDELKKIVFQEVSGLEAETQVIEYRAGNSPVFSTVKMPGIQKYGNVTMKKGVFVNDNSFWNWYQQIKMNTIQQRTIIIKLLDESGSVTMQWTLHNAWPSKVTSTGLKADGNEVAIDSIEIEHEQITITNG